jgi:pimeloyl-ACP methyl ester carboxylesterase
MRPGGIIASLLFFVTQCVCAAASPPPWRSVDLRIPVTDEDGSTTDLEGRACRPATDAPATVVVINHGSPPGRDRPFMHLFPCDDEASAWFLTRGYVVVEALRRGYGATGGEWAESYGPCDDADYIDAGREGARDIAAIVRAAEAFSFARPTGAIVVGQSAGGWGSLAFASQPHPDVAAIILMEPGRGSDRHGDAGSNCSPDRLIAAAGFFGRTERDGLLWISTANDSYFAPPLVTAMQAAFTAAGGVATLRHLGPYGREGHHLFFGPGGSAIWGPVVTEYLGSRRKTG